MAVAFLLRFLWIGRSGLWSDELFSVYYARLSPHFLWNEGLRLETNPPLYYTFLHYWIRVFGSSEVAVRLPSALFSLASVWLVIVIGRKVSGPWVGWLAGLLMAILAHQIFFAHEARAYALAMMAICIALLGWVLFLQAKNVSFEGLGLYVLGGALCIHAHSTGGLFVVACNLCWGLFAMSLKESSRKIIAWLAANFLILLLTLPLLAPLFLQWHSPNLDWIPRPNLNLLLSVLSQQVLGPSFPYWGRQFLGIALLILLAVLIVKRALKREEVLLYVFLPLVFLLLMYVVSLDRPILLPRTALWISAPLCWIAAKVLVGHSRAQWRRVAKLSMALIFGLGFVASFGGDAKEDWRGLSQKLQKEVDPTYVPIFSEYVPSYVVEHYAPGLTSRDAKHLEYRSSAPMTAEISIGNLYNPTQRIFLSQFSEMIAENRPVFLVLRKIDSDSFAQELAQLPRPPDVVLNSPGGVSAMIWR